MTKNEAEQIKIEAIPLNPGPQWAEVKKEFTLKFENKDLADLVQATDWRTTLAFSLSPGAGVLYIDDMKIIEK